MSKIESFIQREKELNVENVVHQGRQIWPILRVYIGSLIVFQKDRRIGISGKSLSLARYLFYGFKNWFGKYDAIVFTASDQRRILDNLYTDRCDQLPGKNLIVEQPVGKHYPRRRCKSPYLVSKMAFYLREKLLKPFVRVEGIENETVITQFVEASEISFDHINRLKTFYAQYKIYSRFFRRKKPKQVYLINSYINMAIVKAAKDQGITVIEFQHGVINKTHYAYNVIKPFDKSYYPDQLLTFGNQEVSTFDESNHFINPEHVHPVGSFIIDYTNQSFKADDRFGKLAAAYSIRVAITSQDAYEDVIIPFVKTMAEMAPDILFVFIPRLGDETDYNFESLTNIVFVPWLNTYQIIKNCTFHTTLTSTCAIESPSLGIPNVLMDIDDRATAYYGDVLTSRNFTFYGKTPEACIHLFRNTQIPSSSEIMSTNSDQILTNYNKNIQAWRS